jgi:hypothetical protein
MSMRRLLGLIGLIALPLGGCVEVPASGCELLLGACALLPGGQYDTMNNGLGYSYLVDSQDQIPNARQQAEQACGSVGRLPRLSNVTQFQHVLTVFDCRPEGEVRFEAKPTLPAS